jgi:hypothetical protein
MRRYLPFLLLGALGAFVFVALPHAASGDGGPSVYKRVTHQRGELAFGSITAATAGTANTVLTATKDAVVVSIENTTNAELIITKGGADFKRVPAGSFRVFDFRSDAVALSAGTWGVYRSGTPSSGNLEIIVLPAW